MTTKLRLIVPPAVSAVSVAEAKAWLRLTEAENDEDATIAGMIRAAVNLLDGRSGFLGRCLIEQTWELALDSFPDGEIYVPLGPIASVTSVGYTDGAGAGTVDPGDYALDNAATFDGRIVPRDGFAWPATLAAVDAVRVSFVAGAGPSWNSIPEGVRQAIMNMVASVYDSRGCDTGRMLSPGVVSDLAPFRRPAVF